MGARTNRRGALVVSLLAVGIFWTLPVACQEGRRASGPAGSSHPARSPKISPVLARTLDRMEQAGVTRHTMGSYDLEDFSDRLVRVDRQGRVQVEIYLHQLDDRVLSELRAAGVKVELTNRRHHVVEGWVSFYLVERVTQVANVKRIRPPDYGVPRSRGKVPLKSPPRGR